MNCSSDILLPNWLGYLVTLLWFFGSDFGVKREHEMNPSSSTEKKYSLIVTLYIGTCHIRFCFSYAEILRYNGFVS